MTDIVERLRYGSLCPVSGDGDKDKLDAANEIESLRQQLAASQAREVQLRGQILRMIDRWWPFVHKELFASDTARELYREASDSIQPPYDFAALEAMITKAGEVMRERCNAELSRLMCWFTYEPICALPEVTLKDLE